MYAWHSALFDRDANVDKAGVGAVVEVVEVRVRGVLQIFRENFG